MKRLKIPHYLIVMAVVPVVLFAFSLDWSGIAASTSAIESVSSPTLPAQVGTPIRYSSSLTPGSDGFAYGTANRSEDNKSAADQWGIVFRLSESGHLDILHSFSHTDGAFPVGRLVEARDGFFYGVTSKGGEGGAHPLAGLVEDESGNLYGAFTGITTLSAAVWYHVAVTYDGANTRLYVNGVAEGIQAGVWAAANSQPLSIGQRGDNADFFNGLIDEIEIFNRALSVEEIQSLYNAGSFGKCKPALVIAATGQCSATVNYTAPSFSDNCSIASISCLPAAGTIFLKGTTTVTCTTTDRSGNSSANAFEVKVSDGEPPMISCPSPVIVNTDSGQCAAVVNYTTPTATVQL